jgi:hypothetical protein
MGRMCRKPTKLQINKKQKTKNKKQKTKNKNKTLFQATRNIYNIKIITKKKLINLYKKSKIRFKLIITF